MASQARIVRLLTAPLTFWTALFVVGSYFVFSFDKKAYDAHAAQGGIVNTVKAAYNSVGLSRVKKGIDLAGGTYLVLSVDLEKALDARLGIENKAIEGLFQSKDLKVFPKTKEIKNNAIVFAFDDEEAAKVCENVIRDSKGQALHVKRTGVDVFVTLATEAMQAIRSGAVEQAVNVLNNRLGSYGVEGIVVQQHGERQIVVMLPGVNDPERVKSVITQTAHLEFKIVEQVASSRETLLDKFDGELPADKMIIPGKRNEEEVGGQFYLVSAFPDITGDRIIEARVGFDQYNKPEVAFKLDSVGAREFADLTAANVGRNLGIIIDNVMYSAPNIRQSIPGGQCSITNIGTQKDALDLSIVLRSGSLQAPLKFEQESRVGASLGQDSIYKGMLSCMVALIILFFFSIFYYKIPGFFAVLALLFNLFLTLIFLSYFGATLTLPGIAGMVLTIGMAIDASILIYERIKEELRAGVSLRAAVNNGFHDAMAVILDSNITTFLTGVVLFYFGGPAIKGFAVTLMAGIVATILAGVYFLKSLFTFTLDVLGAKTMKF
ncbi:protein translocase subunit SecD [Candidatus Dependentiae bacterium]|nr:protein translocase subunit SecD [Candidatus Dependentiae bacterium]